MKKLRHCHPMYYVGLSVHSVQYFMYFIAVFCLQETQATRWSRGCWRRSTTPQHRLSRRTTLHIQIHGRWSSGVSGCSSPVSGVLTDLGVLYCIHRRRRASSSWPQLFCITFALHAVYPHKLTTQCCHDMQRYSLQRRRLLTCRRRPLLST